MVPAAMLYGFFYLCALVSKTNMLLDPYVTSGLIMPLRGNISLPSVQKTKYISLAKLKIPDHFHAIIHISEDIYNQNCGSNCRITM